MTRNIALALGLVLLTVSSGAILAVRFQRALAAVPPLRSSCVTEYGDELRRTSADPLTPMFEACVRHRASLFLTADYAESKDLARSFLTLLVAVFVASITFSEKVVDLARSTTAERTLIVMCWFGLLVAIITCGAALAALSAAAGYATYSPFRDYRSLEGTAVQLFTVAGLGFAVGLGFLLCAGILRVSRPRQPITAA